MLNTNSRRGKNRTVKFLGAAAVAALIAGGAVESGLVLQHAGPCGTALHGAAGDGRSGLR